MGRPNEDPGPVASSCYRLLADLAHYAMSRRSIIPSVSRRTLNGSAVVAIGVDRGGVGTRAREHETTLRSGAVLCGLPRVLLLAVPEEGVCGPGPFGPGLCTLR
jgi:hypothetical protein